MDMFYVHVVKTLFLYTTLPPTKGVDEPRNHETTKRTPDVRKVGICALLWLLQSVP
jgi:hypothetical protein